MLNWPKWMLAHSGFVSQLRHSELRQSPPFKEFLQSCPTFAQQGGIILREAVSCPVIWKEALSLDSKVSISLQRDKSSYRACRNPMDKSSCKSISVK